MFIVTAGLGAVYSWFFYLDTNGLPLEEVATVFGVSLTILIMLRPRPHLLTMSQDHDEVVIYQREITFDRTTKTVVATAGKGMSDHIEDA